MSKLIPLTQGLFAEVDDADYDWLMGYKWCASANRKGGYYYASTWDGSKTVKMHRLIMGVSGRWVLVDHIDHNTLNNQRGNLRIATQQQNNFNRKSVPKSTSNFRGVSWYSRDKRWVARIGNGSSQKTLGWFKDEKQAALAYNAAAIERYGEFANLNKV